MVARKSGENLTPGFMRSFRSSESQDAEIIHKDALDAARAEHERVREAAIRAFQNHEIRISQSYLRDAAAQEAERLQLEREHAELAARVIELQRTHIPIPTPPPREPTPPPPPPPAPKVETRKVEPVRVPDPAPTPPAPAKSPFQAPLLQPQPQKSASTSKITNGQPSSQASQSVAQNRPPESQQLQQNPASIPSHILPGAQRYLEIHSSLKKLRKFMTDSAKSNPSLKSKMGEMRRSIRTSVGQLTEGQGVNKIPTDKIRNTLKEALRLPSPPIDASMFTLRRPQPTGGANDGDTLPSLFIYLLNVFAKACISQFVNEAGAAPKAAEPVGLVAVSIFADLELVWRGMALIDILMAKMRAVCPVLWGLRGNEKTEEGRARLGWKKDENGWVIEQVHNTRMTGLGAGYAAISLRNFAKTTRTNPYPPSKYWQSMATIVGTPEPSSTHFMVLKAMIENYEQRFLSFYGNAGRAALRIALVEFPERAREQSAAATSLKVLGDKLRRDVGLRLK